MDRIEKHLAEVNRALFGMERKAREGIVSELRSHISEAFAEAKTPEEKVEIFASLENPRISLL